MIRRADDRQVLVICRRTSDEPVSSVPHSIRVPCARCGAEVWLSPASAKLGGKRLCTECFNERGIVKGDQLQRPTADQMDEVMEALRSKEDEDEARESPPCG